MSTTLNLQVGASGDDFRWNEGNSYFTATDTAIDVGYQDGTTTRKNAGFRFTNVTAPKNASIVSAKLTLRSTSTPTSQTVVNLKIDAILATNPSAPTTYAGAEGATRTSAVVNWDNVGAWAASTNYDSPDITSVIQELVNQSGWASGNAMVIYLEDNGSSAVNGTTRQFQTYDNYAPNAPKLQIVYNDPVTARTLALTGVGQ